jgi:hypothetical protein
VNRLNRPDACSSAEKKQANSQPPKLIGGACPARVCRGALGFRARETRKQEHSVVKDPAAGAPSQGRPEIKTYKIKTERKNEHSAILADLESIFEANSARREPF